MSKYIKMPKLLLSC
jgi:hypothetical protein